MIFDTSLRADSTTGLPPVKAKVKHRKNVQSKDSTAQTSSEQRTTKVEKQTQDKGTKQTNTHNKTKEQKKPAYTVFYPWFCGLLFVVLVIAVGMIKYNFCIGIIQGIDVEYMLPLCTYPFGWHSDELE